MGARNKLKKLIMGNKSGEFDLIIEPNKTSVDFFRELIKFRELFFFMAWRDILVRYKQTVIIEHDNFYGCIRQNRKTSK